MTSIVWCDKKIDGYRFIVPHFFESNCSAWILVRLPGEENRNKYLTFNTQGTYVDLSIRHLRKRYFFTNDQLYENDPIGLYQILISKVLALYKLYETLYAPLNELYHHNVWISDPLLKTLQKVKFLGDAQVHITRKETRTAFSVTIYDSRFILNTRKKHEIEGNSHKEFKYSVDSKRPDVPIIKVTNLDNPEEFDREWNIYNLVISTSKEKAPEGILIPHGLVNRGKKVIYLPKGKTLEEQPVKSNKIPQTFLALIKGLMWLHEKGYAHGDPKCQNVLMIDGEPKLFDFGFSLPFGKSLPHCYTQGYHAPEYYSHERDTKWQDIYALGVTFYEIYYKSRCPFIYSYTETHNQAHINWSDKPSEYPVVQVIKSLMHPIKAKRMSLLQARLQLESVNRPTQAS